MAWQRKIRLEGAACQLQITDHSITAIAADFGYELPGNFATAFRRHFGMTPNTYRKKVNSATV
jgi:AraC-like DNA-binding protein